MEQRFDALRTVGRLLKMVAIIVLVGGFVAGGGLLMRGDMGPDGHIKTAAFLGALAVMIVAAVVGLLLFAAAEIVFVALAIEENTRKQP